MIFRFAGPQAGDLPGERHHAFSFRPRRIRHLQVQFGGTLHERLARSRDGADRRGPDRHQGVAAADLPYEGNIGSFDGATGWLNSQPLTPSGLRGHVVVVQF